ncbi:MAG: hypothetical protein WA840_08755 [Caulobacteraceae bacterium]
MDGPLIRAQGKLAALFASVLESAGIITADEFGDLLALFAATVAEASPQEGEILALWAATILGNARGPDVREASH